MIGRHGRITPLHSPFANASLDGVSTMQDVAPQAHCVFDASRPCTRGQSGSAAAVSYAELDRGTPHTSSDSGTCSAGPASREVPPVKEKKKVGRPITYKGDINSKDLTEAERRRIKRRVANRESARRVRQKRQETMEEMSARMDAMQQHAAALATRLSEVQAHKAALVAQLGAMCDKWSNAVSENARLQQESSTRSSATKAEFDLPDTSEMPPSPHTVLPLMPQQQPPYSTTAGGSAITSGQPSDLRIPSVTSSTQIAGFRPGVTITSFGGGPGAAQPQQHHFTVPTSQAHTSGPASVPTVSLAPTSGSLYVQVPQAQPAPQHSHINKADMLQQPQLQTQQYQPQQHQLDATPSLNDPLAWFLGQPSLDCSMLDDSALLK